MRNNLRTVYEKIREIKDKTPAQVSMMNMLSELTEHSVGGYADMQEQIILFDCGSRLFKGQIEVEFRQGQETMTARLVFPVNCCKETREKTARLCHIINRSMLLGSFEYDLRSGECALRYVHYYGDTAMGTKQVCKVIGVMISTIRRYEGTLIPLLTGKEPADRDACREYRMLVDLPAEAPAATPVVRPTAAEEAPAAEQSARPSAAQEAPAEESRPAESGEQEANKPTEEAQSAAEPPRSPLAFNVDNDEMLRLFNDSCSESEERRRRRNEPQPVAGNEADEEREHGGIPIEPEVADAFELEPGQIGIALNDSGEMVGLLTGGASEQEEGNGEAPVNGEAAESPSDDVDDEVSVSGEDIFEDEIDEEETEGEDETEDETEGEEETESEETASDGEDDDGDAIFPELEIDFSFLNGENVSDEENAEDAENAENADGDVVIPAVQAEVSEPIEADSADDRDGGDAADGNPVRSAQNPSEDEEGMEDGLSDDCRSDEETTSNDGMSDAPAK